MRQEEAFEWKYAPAPEAAEQAKLRERYGLFIGGKFVSPRDGSYVVTVDPSAEKPLAEYAAAGEKDVNAAVLAASKAFSGWRALGGQERGRFLFRIARKIQERSRELAVTESLDNGKPIRESRDFDVPAAAAHFFYYAGWSDKLQYAFPGRSASPIGVAAQVIPWNFPLLMAAWKIAPALAAGNTVVLKPAETTPLTALKLAEILQECGLPEGVVNIIGGDGTTGDLLVKHRLVNKIAFTGSTAVGKSIQRHALRAGKRLTLELGGKGAHIVFDDAAIDQAVEGIVNGIYFNQGQVCCAGSRLFVQESVADQVILKLKQRMSRLIVGHPLDKNTDIGAINSSRQLEKVRSYLSSAKADGAELFETECRLPSRGLYCRPSLVSGLTQAHRAVSEEIFGPVLCVQSFRTTEEVIEKANNTPYGLSAGVWTDKGSKAFSVSRQLKAGVVWNNSFNRFDPGAPFGGYKESGFGREGGLHGLMPYLELKHA
jgi:aldehyde dehydrogenase (NAD+)